MFQNLHRSMAREGTLKIQCDVCSHLATFNAPDAKATFGSDATPMDIRRRAVCRICRATGRARVWI